MKEVSHIAKCFSFCYQIESEQYDEEGIFGLICTFNDTYEDLTYKQDTNKYLQELKNILEKITGREIFIFNRIDSDYKVFIEDIEEQKFDITNKIERNNNEKITKPICLSS